MTGIVIIIFLYVSDFFSRQQWKTYFNVFQVFLSSPSTGKSPSHRQSMKTFLIHLWNSLSFKVDALFKKFWFLTRGICCTIVTLFFGSVTNLSIFVIILCLSEASNVLNFFLSLIFRPAWNVMIFKFSYDYEFFSTTIPLPFYFI